MAVSSLITVKDKSVLSEIQYHTLEPQDGGVAFTSGMWKTEDATGSLMATYSAFIARTRTRAFYKGMSVTANQYRYSLHTIDQGLVDIIRMGWGAVLELRHIYVPTTTGIATSVSTTDIFTGWCIIQAKLNNIDRSIVTSDGVSVGIDLWPGASIIIRAEGMEDIEGTAVNLADIQIRGITGDGVNVLYWQHNQSQLPSLHREDTHAFDQIRPTWKTGTTNPIAYSMVTQPVGYIDLMPCPVSNGALNIWYTCIPAELSGNMEMAGITPEFNYHIKYGAMAMMLGNEGPPNDPERAAYCDQRFQEGIELAQLLCNEE
jgi:hypothetical protein